MRFGKSSNSYVAGTDDGVAAARTIYRRPLENRWSVERITRLTATPWSTRGKSDATVSFMDAPTEEGKGNKRIGGVPKAFGINSSDLSNTGSPTDALNATITPYPKRVRLRSRTTQRAARVFSTPS